MAKTKTKTLQELRKGQTPTPTKAVEKEKAKAMEPTKDTKKNKGAEIREMAEKLDAAAAKASPETSPAQATAPVSDVATGPAQDATPAPTTDVATPAKRGRGRPKKEAPKPKFDLSSPEAKERAIEAAKSQYHEVAWIPVAEVKASDDYNIRFRENYEGGEIDASAPTEESGNLEQMKLSLATVGQLQPVGVYPDGKGRYHLAYGFRRFNAIKALGWDKIHAVIMSPDSTESDVKMKQAAENLGRKSLLAVETAVAVCDLARLGNKPDQIAAALTMTPANVKNYYYLTALCPEVWAMWRKNPYTLERVFLNSIKGLAAPEQIRLAREKLAGGGAAEPAPKPKRERKVPEDKAEARPETEAHTFRGALLSGAYAARGDAWVMGALEATEYLMGLTQAAPATTGG